MTATPDTPTPAHGCSEGQLLSRARDGDRRAFDELQLSLQPQVRRFAAHILDAGSYPTDLAGAIDEVTQEVFLALFRSLARVGTVQHLRPFLFRVCRNLCYDRMRRRSGRLEMPLADEADEGGAAQACPSPDEAAMWTLALLEVDEALVHLPEPQRLAVYLYAEEGMGYEEVAEATGADIGTVKSRIFNARKKLRARISPGLLQALGLTKEA